MCGILWRISINVLQPDWSLDGRGMCAVGLIGRYFFVLADLLPQPMKGDHRGNQDVEFSPIRRDLFREGEFILMGGVFCLANIYQFFGCHRVQVFLVDSSQADILDHRVLAHDANQLMQKINHSFICVFTACIVNKPNQHHKAAIAWLCPRKPFLHGKEKESSVGHLPSAEIRQTPFFHLDPDKIETQR
jgi:hypothetical protein